MPLQRFARAMRGTYEPGTDDAWWYDNLLHFGSGAIIGALAHTILGVGLVQAGVVFLACAVVWELYEYAYGIRPWDDREDWTRDRAVEDTLLDTYVGLTGALVVVWLLA